MKEIVIHNYPRKFKVSDKQRAKYKDGVVINANKIGTPRFIPIKGQYFYSGINEHVRMKMVEFLHKFFEDEIESRYQISPVKEEEYPVKIHIMFYTHVLDKDNPRDGANWDIDNYSYPYTKTLIDTLVHLGVLRNDTIQFVSSITSSFVPLYDENIDRSIKVLIEPDLVKKSMYEQYNLFSLWGKVKRKKAIKESTRKNIDGIELQLNF